MKHPFRGVGRHILTVLPLVVMAAVPAAYGDDAAVLPRGIWSTKVENQFFLPITKRYDKDGNVEDAAADFNANLNGDIFSDLNAFKGPPFNVADPTIGRSVVSFKYEIDYLNLTIARGLTDRLTIGVVIPYWWQRNKVNASLDASQANIGKNPLQGLPACTGGATPPSCDPFGGQAPLIPIGSLGPIPVARLSTEDVQNLLGRGLDVNGDGSIDIPGFGYKRIETWSDEGFSDIDVGAKYQYLNNNSWRLAMTGGVRLPTGKVDDPDNLVDRGFGNGAWALLFVSNNDYVGIPRLVLDGTVRYFLYLPHTETLRLQTDPHRPITDLKGKVDRDPGDQVELEASAKYEVARGATLSLLYKYGHIFKDKVTFNGARVRGLEEETDATEHVGIAALSYSTIPLFNEKKFPVPLVGSLSYRNRFAGTNSTLKSQYIALTLQLFF